MAIEITSKELDDITESVLSGHPFTGMKPNPGMELTNAIKYAVTHRANARALCRSFLSRGGMFHKIET